LQLRKGTGDAPVVAKINAAILRKELKLTQSDVADSLGVTSRTVQNWEARGTAPARRLRDLAELHELITAYLEIGERSTWMDGPNQAFGGNTPRSLIREGKTRDLIIEFRRVQIGEPL
jgi:transcriptional regulator with XRE-family HTH domain